MLFAVPLLALRRLRDAWQGQRPSAANGAGPGSTWYSKADWARSSSTVRAVAIDKTIPSAEGPSVPPALTAPGSPADSR